MLRFAVVGIAATALHYLVYYLLLSVLNPNMAYTIGYAFSFVCNYFLSSVFTFRVAMSWQRLAAFGFSHLLNYLIGLSLLNLMIFMGLSAEIAPLPVFVLVVPINYLLVRYALKRKSGNSDSYLLFLLLVGVAMFVLQLSDVPTLSDDMLYRFVWNTDADTPFLPIDSLGALLRSQVLHYQSVNGRFVVHSLAQAFLSFTPPLLLHILNAVLFVLLLHLCSLLTGRVGKRLVVSAFSCFMLFVVFRGIGTTMLWSLGSFNYLWVSVATLALLLLLQRKAEKEVNVSDWMLAPLAIIAGNGHEAISVPLSASFAIYLVCHLHKCRSLATTPYMVFYMVGMLIILLSPGLLVRTGDAASLQSRLLSGAMNMVFNVRVLWILLLVMVVSWRKHSGLVRDFLRHYNYFFVALSVSAAIVCVCGVNLDRVAFYTDFLSLLLLLPLLFGEKYGVAGSLSEAWERRLTAVSIGLSVVFFIPAYLLRDENRQNYEQMAEQMAAPGRETVGVPIMEKGSCLVRDLLVERYVNPTAEFGFFCCYMGFNSSDTNMRAAASLYGKHSLVFLPADVVERIESDSLAFSTCQLSADGSLYIYRLPRDGKVTSLVFHLNHEDPDCLMPHQRLVAYHGDSYELDDFRYKVVHVYGKPYLVFTRPTTNIFRRIKRIEYTLDSQQVALNYQ